MDSKLWLEAGDEAMDKEFHGHYDIWGGDIDPAAVELAKHNAELAGWTTASALKWRTRENSTGTANTASW